MGKIILLFENQIFNKYIWFVGKDRDEYNELNYHGVVLHILLPRVIQLDN